MTGEFYHKGELVYTTDQTFLINAVSREANAQI